MKMMISFIKMNQTPLSNGEFSARCMIALRGDLPRARLAVLESNQCRYGGCDYATCKTSVEEKARDEIHSGPGGSRFDIFDGRRRICSSRADAGCGASADRRSWSSDYAWR